MIRILSTLVLASVVFACGSAETTGTTFLNAECPMMGGEIDEELVAEFGDGKVGFCCAKCIPKWEELSAEEKQAKVDAAQ